jgi:hypothetical protein
MVAPALCSGFGLHRHHSVLFQTPGRIVGRLKPQPFKPKIDSGIQIAIHDLSADRIVAAVTPLGLAGLCERIGAHSLRSVWWAERTTEPFAECGFVRREPAKTQLIEVLATGDVQFSAINLQFINPADLCLPLGLAGRQSGLNCLHFGCWGAMGCLSSLLKIVIPRKYDILSPTEGRGFLPTFSDNSSH